MAEATEATEAKLGETGDAIIGDGVENADEPPPLEGPDKKKDPNVVNGPNESGDDATNQDAELPVAEANESYKIISLKFAVYNSGKIAVLDKKEEATEQTEPLPDAVVVYADKARVEDSIPKAIAKLNENPDADVKKPVVETTDAAVVETTDAAAEEKKKDAAADAKTDAAADAKTVDDKVGTTPGGSRKTQPKNVSFSRKYPKNKSNKKTLRNLERIVSH